MKPRWLWSGALLLAAMPVLGALGDQAQPQSAKEQYDGIVQEYQKAQAEYSKVAVKAKTDEERKAALTLRPNPEQYAKRMLELATKHAKDPVAFDALSWVVRLAPAGSMADQAVAQFSEDHHTHPKIAELCRSLVRNTSPGAEELMRSAAEKSTDKEVQGSVYLSLAQHLKNRSELAARAKKADADALSKQAEQSFERVVKDFAQVKDPRGVLSDLAQRELFELRFLAVGKPAPEITAEDLDGVEFKLSDYRGKVVMLDFWGHW